MPRTARRKSESGVYHVMIRGINQVQLFYDDEDREAFLDRLERYKDECGFSLYAWCLMGNHVHILVRADINTLSTAMKRLQLSYSSYCDRKYERSGYLFQDRFKSKPVDGDTYLLTVVRYIHRNPLEVGGRVDEWTSFGEYTGSPFITDTGFVLSMLANQECSAVDVFRELVEGSQRQKYLCGFEEPHRISDSEAKEIICCMADIGNCKQLCDMARESQCRIIGSCVRRDSPFD